MNETILVVALDEEGGISKNGGIPWNFTEDKKFFRQFLNGRNAIICGRKTYEELVKFAPNENYYIVSNSLPNSYKTPVIAYETAKYHIALKSGIHRDNMNIIIAGGVNVFDSLIKFSTLCFVTQIKGNFYCDRICNSSLEGKYNSIEVFSCDEYKRVLYT